MGMNGGAVGQRRHVLHRRQHGFARAGDHREKTAVQGDHAAIRSFGLPSRRQRADGLAELGQMVLGERGPLPVLQLRGGAGAELVTIPRGLGVTVSDHPLPPRSPLSPARIECNDSRFPLALAMDLTIQPRPHRGVDLALNASGGDDLHHTLAAARADQLSPAQRRRVFNAPSAFNLTGHGHPRQRRQTLLMEAQVGVGILR